MVIIKEFIPIGRRNRPGLHLEPTSLTIHDTANSKKGAGAKAHSIYVRSKAAARIPVSWHFVVDNKQIIQNVPLDEVAWHAGDGRNGLGNRTSMGIEICQNIDGDRGQAEKNAAWLTAHLLQRLSLDIDKVKQHFDWSGKNCPNVLRGRENGWRDFLRRVQDTLGGMSMRRQYIVRSGDTFWGIAAKHGLSRDQIRNFNPQIKDVSRLRIGQVIFLEGETRTEKEAELPSTEQIDFVLGLLREALIQQAKQC
ncbi:MAG: N-acetylmuramoyl-L-alanine amidase [Alkaliphilus sp.]